jgi:DNA-binding NtrC family response regulator
VPRATENDVTGGDDDWQSLLGESPAIKRLLRDVQAIARHDATVLLQGETGSGKERVARLIHRLSARALKPFVICNCSAVVPTLAESELFGHEKGAFTGARRAKAGLFEAARGGTLFFDQIQELPLTLQPKLLRVLENREFTRLGATRPMKTDVRVIAAANRDLREAVGEKRFREDLFYRMNTATLTIPPLRERREDIPLLVEHFLAYFSKHFRKPTRLISRDAMNRLMAHPWEGNVRELRNAIERAVAVSRHRVITHRDLTLDPPARPSPYRPELAPAELISLDELERNQIRRVLELTGGNRERAAKALGLSRSTLYRRLAELGL